MGKQQKADELHMSCRETTEGPQYQKSLGNILFVIKSGILVTEKPCWKKHFFKKKSSWSTFSI